MEAPKGVQILAEAGDIQAICRNELRLESKDGEVRATNTHTHLQMKVKHIFKHLNQKEELVTGCSIHKIFLPP